MPRQILMESLIESDQRWFSRQSVTPKVISAVIQVGVIALLIVVPLLATDSMPVPKVMMTFVAPPPPPPPPPPPMAARNAAKAKEASIPKPVPAVDFVAPVEISTQVAAEEVAFEADSAIGGLETGGIPDGVEGGIPGGPTAEPIRVGGEVRPPKKLKDVLPEYPVTARNARIEGTVILEAVIDSRGMVTAVRVLKSIPLLDEAAINAVKQWRYQATMLNGEAVAIVMTVTVNFGLDRA